MKEVATMLATASSFLAQNSAKKINRVLCQKDKVPSKSSWRAAAKRNSFDSFYRDSNSGYGNQKPV